jgi:hypothetical protein
MLDHRYEIFGFQGYRVSPQKHKKSYTVRCKNAPFLLLRALFRRIIFLTISYFCKVRILYLGWEFLWRKNFMWRMRLYQNHRAPCGSGSSSATLQCFQLINTVHLFILDILRDTVARFFYLWFYDVEVEYIGKFESIFGTRGL